MFRNRPSASECLQIFWIVHHSAVGTSSSSSSSSSSSLKPLEFYASPPADTLVPAIHGRVTQCGASQDEHTPRKRSYSSNISVEAAAAKESAEDKENHHLTASLLPLKSPKMIRHGSSFRMKPKKLQQQMKLRRSHSLMYLSHNSPVKAAKTSGVTMSVQSPLLMRVNVSQINEWYTVVILWLRLLGSALNQSLSWIVNSAMDECEAWVLVLRDLLTY